jgi:indolepyruvate ferredoxin oxidoreductase alpha subunit
MNVDTIDPVAQPEQLQQALRQALADSGLHVLIVRRPCILAAGDIKKYEQQAKAAAAEPVAQQCECNCACKEG